MTTMGLLTHRIPNPRRFDHWAQEAEKLGFSDTVLFTPERIRHNVRRLHAFRYRRGVWEDVVCPYPDVIHDLGYYVSHKTVRLVRRFKHDPNVECVGYGLGHKWEIHNKLQRSGLERYLPATRLYKGPGTVIAMAGQYGAVVLKPRNGKGGTGIVKVERTHDRKPSSYIWQDRRERRVMMTEGRLLRKLDRSYTEGDILVQQWLDIRDRDGRVYDVRALMQKQPNHSWGMTAIGVRKGAEGTIKANLRAGGAVHPLLPFLSGQFGESKAETIADELTRVAVLVPGLLETAYGKPFIELGIDLAVERKGTVKIIEVNVKPGKKIVRALSGEKAYADALFAPIRYAAVRAGIGAKSDS
ncbi:YheC/YheD family endospore coat-associated protein [Paenibacillus alkalitolerans]|uniref:YheC/YheD family endospore coat-associated protein n=1 Tax=Paenibacillus alkalitolerans TaxID=2799335 RepID=UPI0018F5F078|nr:YheC/YheD family protein [Paenibacillus alkalitolerans]